MIGKSDDTEAGPTGPVDGSVDASIFNEDQFAQTAISSSQKIVFIGWPEGTGDYIDAIRLDKFQSRAWFCQDGTPHAVAAPSRAVANRTLPSCRTCGLLEHARLFGVAALCVFAKMDCCCIWLTS